MVTHVEPPPLVPSIRPSADPLHGGVAALTDHGHWLTVGHQLLLWNTGLVRDQGEQPTCCLLLISLLQGHGDGLSQQLLLFL